MRAAISTRHYFAVGAFAGATLFCEIALTRLFSVVQYYHGAFLAISLALFGFAASGVFVFLRSDTLTRERLDSALAFYGALFAISIPLSFYSYLYVGFGGLAGVAGQALEYALLAVPFFAAGVCISLLLTHGASSANRLYAVDLCASSVGGLLVIPALALLGGPKSMLLASALAASASFPFVASLQRGRFVAPAVAGVALLVAVAVPTSTFNQFQLRKPAFAVAEEPIYWNSFSMVGVTPEKRTNVPVPVDEIDSYVHRNIVIDNSVVTEIMRFDGDLGSVSFLLNDPTAPVHLLRPDSRVLIIGSGGGRDILVAKVYGQPHVRAVEVNPLVARMARDTFGDFAGGVYSGPDVQHVVGDARSYIANSDERFDIILASLIDTWAASAAGAFALTENLLYTRDAFRDYYAHLSDDGFVSIGRWHPSETPRLLSTALAGWRDSGVAKPLEHAMLVVSATPSLGGRVAMLVLKKTPILPEEIVAVEAFCERTGSKLALAPGRAGDPRIAEFLKALAADRVDDLWPGADLEPASDERPFFFNVIKPSTQLRRLFGVDGADERSLASFPGNVEATKMLIQLFVAVLLLLVITVVGPLALRGEPIRGPRWGAVFGYFSCLGLGYMLIQIGLVQRLILLLGQPVYSLAVILSTMLLASGLGSYASGRIAADRLPARLPPLLVAAAALLAVYSVLLPPLIEGLLGTPFPVRVVTAALVVALPAFLMGMPFPSGVRALGEWQTGTSIPWVWGINGATSVLASVGGIILAIQFGYTLVFVAGALCYLAAALLFRDWAGARPMA